MTNSPEHPLTPPSTTYRPPPSPSDGQVPGASYAAVPPGSPPPHGYPPADPARYAPPGYAAPYQLPYGGPGITSGASDASEARRRAGTALGWAIGAVVAASVALVFGLGALIVATSADGPYPDGGDDLFGGGYPGALRGTISGFSPGDTVDGDALERQITAQQSADGYSQDVIRCPDTPSARASSAIVCTGELDGEEWTGVVFIEDDAGTFVVLEL
ncbi:MAG: hypothetical protein ACRCSN_13900 [Dermatophilaceae bacterium]